MDRTFAYADPYNRMTQATSTVNGQAYTMNYTYDGYDRLVTQSYPSGLVITNEYDASGALYRVKDPSIDLFTTVSMNGLGQYDDYLMADGTEMKKAYEHGFLLRKQGGAQDLMMSYDYATGNMRDRWDVLKSRSERFDYDELDRLTRSQVHIVDANGQPISGVSSLEYGYDGNIGSTRGNLILRADIGQLAYGGHAVVAARNMNYPTPPNAPPDVISQATQLITYTPFLKTATVTEQVAGDNYALAYEYGPELQRTRSMLTKNGSTQTERIYLGGYEKQTINGVVQEIHYIQGGDGLCAMLVKTDGAWQTYATYTDHLGSILTLTNASDGSVVAEQNYDPWGRRRDASTWTYTAPAPPDWLYRGFTGHEHMDPFSLINMNGRMYDPNNGRMMSVDNYVNGAWTSQSYNRFSYAANNPLVYSDPSGDIVWAPIIIGAALGAYSGGLMANGGEFNPTQWDYSSGRTWKHMLGGALVGGASGAVGYAAATSGLPGANTAGMVFGSLTNSMGMHLLSGGRTSLTASFGAASYDFSSGSFDYLGQKGQSFIQGFSYALGAIGNLSDALAGWNPGEVQLQTENNGGSIVHPTKDKIGHSQLIDVSGPDRRILVDFGPGESGFKGFGEGTNNWDKGMTIMENYGIMNKIDPKMIAGVNLDRLNRISDRLNASPGFYNFLFRACSHQCSRALTMSGVPTLGLHPYLLNAQIALRNAGVRPVLFSYHGYGY